MFMRNVRVFHLVRDRIIPNDTFRSRVERTLNTLVGMKEEVNDSYVNCRFRKIIVIPYDKKKEHLEYEGIPFEVEELHKKSKKELLEIYKKVRNKTELKKLPEDFLDNLFECTKKYVRSMLPYEFVRIYKTMQIVKYKDKQLNLLMHQQMKRIHKNFDPTSICKLFQIYTFTKSKPTQLIKSFAKTLLKNIEEAKPWYIRELVFIFCHFHIDPKGELIDQIYKSCIPKISKHISMYTPKDVTIIFYSYVKMQKYNKSLLQVTSKHVITNIDKYKFGYLALILNSYAKTGEKNSQMCKVICQKIQKQMQSEVKEQKMKEEMKNEEIENLCKMKPKDLSLILNAFIKLEFYDHQTFHAVIPFIINSIKQFSPQSLSNIVHAYSQIQIHHELLMDKIVKESIIKIHKFKNKELSNLANSLVRLNRKDRMLFTYVADEFLYRATIGTHFLNYEFDILSIQQLTYSFSKVGLQDEKVFNIAHKLLMRKMSQIGKKLKKEKKQEKPETINEKNTNISNLEELHTSCIPFQNNFDFFSLATFIHSCGKVKTHHKHITHFISFIIRQKKKNKEVITNQSLVNTLMGLVNLQIKDKKLYLMLLKESYERIDSMQPVQCILLLYSFSKLRIYSYKFIKKAIQIISLHMNNISVSDLSITCYALSNFLYRNVVFLYKISRIILLHNFEFDCKIVCQFFNAFTKLCFYHKPFYKILFQKIVGFIHEFKEKELSNIVFSFIYYFHMRILHEHSQNQESRHLLTDELGEQNPTVETNQLVDISSKNSYAKENMNLNNEEKDSRYIERENRKKNVFPDLNPIQRKDSYLYNIRVDAEELLKNELQIFFNIVYVLNEKYRQKISLISIYQLQIVDLYLRCMFKKYEEFPLYLKIFFFKCRNYKLQVDDYVVLSSKMHRNISKFLSLVGISHRSEVQYGPYQLDVVVDFLQNVKKKSSSTLEGNLCKSIQKEFPKEHIIPEGNNKKIHELQIKRDTTAQSGSIESLLNQKILIEIDGVSHFYRESFSRTLNSIIKDFILVKLGWHIIHIPYQEWDQCYNFKKRLLYCFNIWNQILKISKYSVGLNEIIHFINKRYKEEEEEEEKQKHKGGTNEHIYSINRRNNSGISKEECSTENKEKNETTENSLPDFYKIDEETFFLNHMKHRSKQQQHMMRELRENQQL